MVTAINAINKIFCGLMCILLTLTGTLNGFFNSDKTEYTDLGGVVGLESLVRAQGVTTDGENIIYSGKSALEKVSSDNKTVLAINTEAIPSELADSYGIKHIGGISCADGKIYAALEDSKVWKHPIVAVYDAETLEYTGVFYELSTDRHTRGIPWVVADGENGILYAGDSRNYHSVMKYDLDTMEFLGELTFSQEIDEIQGGEYYNGTLYFGTNDTTRAVYSVNADDGTVQKLFGRITYEYKYIDNFGGEGEDVTVMTVDGKPMICTLQIGVTFTDATLRGYEIN